MVGRRRGALATGERGGRRNGRQACVGAGAQAGGGGVAEQELHAGVVPAVQVGRLGEVGVAAQAAAAEAGALAQRDHLIDLRGRTCVRGPVARPIDQAQHFAGLGQGEHQGMAAPGAVVGDVHALLALAAGGDERAVHVDGGLIEESGGLCGPDALADGVGDVMQDLQVRLLEAAAEVAGGGGVGEAAGAEGVEEGFVAAEQFEIFQAGAAAQGVVGEGEDVIGFAIAVVDLRQVEAVVDGGAQAEPLGEGVHDADAAAGDAALAGGDLVMDVLGGEHGLAGRGAVGAVEPALAAALGAGQLLTYLGSHSKSLRSGVVGKLATLPQPRQSRRISSFFMRRRQRAQAASLG